MGLLSYGSMDRRFFHALGASHLARTICSSAGGAGLKATVGKSLGFDPEAIVNARFIVAWGANIVSSNVHLWPFIEEARRRGARFVAVDPYRSRTAEKADATWPSCPGPTRPWPSGVMHVLFRDGLEDADYLARYTVGAAELRARAAEWTPERTARETGLTVAEIEGFAREYGTTRPSAIRLNYGLNRHAGGGMAVRTIACLPAITGRLAARRGRRPALHLGHLPGRQRGPRAAGPRRARHPHPQHEPDRPRAHRPDACARRSRPSSSTTRTRPRSPPSRRRCGRVWAAKTSSPWSTSSSPTDTVDFADIVLPATTTLEHYDLHKAYGHLYLSLSRPAIAPVGESKPNTEVFRLLAARMGLDHASLRDSDEDMARQAMHWEHPNLSGITFDRLEREGSVRLSVADPHAPFAEGGFPTPSGKCELLAPGLEGPGPRSPGRLHSAAGERRRRRLSLPSASLSPSSPRPRITS